MRFFIDVSDKRNRILKMLLEKRGIETAEFYFEETNNIKENDAIVFAPSKKFLTQDIAKLPSNICLFAGNISDELKQILKTKQIKYKNLMEDEIYTIKNANLTAEGILSLMIEKSPRSMFENNVLIVGGGRIAKSLMLLFLKLNINFSIVSFNPTKFPSYFTYTNRCYYGYSFLSDLNRFDCIVNTIPNLVFDEEKIQKIQPGTLFIETASINCLDKNLVKNFTFLEAPGLPTVYSPETAGKLMLENILGENEYEN